MRLAGRRADYRAGLHNSADDPDRRRAGAEFRSFVRRNLESFPTDDLASRLYDDFRNGPSHEARIKKGENSHLIGHKRSVTFTGVNHSNLCTSARNSTSSDVRNGKGASLRQ